METQEYARLIPGLESVLGIVMLHIVSASLRLSLADPPGSSVFVSAVRWLEGTLLGTLATTVAVIAVATVGFMMLAGRVNPRHGATVIAGCFVLFGASSIAAGFQALASGGGGATYQPAPVAAEPVPPPRLPEAPAAPPAPYDPYAGASVPTR